MTTIERRVPLSALDDWPDGLHPVLRQVLTRRDVSAPAELELRLQHLVPVGRFDSLEAAVTLLLAHRDRPVVIVGDFDADGATSTAMLTLALRSLGFGRVEYFIPDRFALGYGLSPGVVAALGRRDEALIVTVDNGISSVDGVAAAHDAGFRVLITDHHLPPAVLPDADVIVNPNVPDAVFPGKHLAGVGVVFYLIAALGRRLGDPALAVRYLDLVALGTVADLVRLDHGNRILVEQGLRRIRSAACRPGILALCRVAGQEPADVVAATLGYQLGPRLNAAGRLDDMSVGVQCLLSESAEEANRLAETLDALNRQRREIERTMKDEAVALVDALLPDDATSLPPALCLSRPDWHEGVVGLIAGRIRERYHRPTFAFAPSGSDELKGSGRSVPGFHLRDALADIDARQPGLITRFGGHAMAAGLTLPESAFDRFASLLSEVGAERLDGGSFVQSVQSDGALEAIHMTLDVARLLRHAAPWGQGFPEPCFDGDFELVARRVLKEAHLKLTLRPATGGNELDAIAFNAADQDWSPGSVRRIAYRLDVNTWFSTPRLQLIVEHIEDPGAA